MSNHDEVDDLDSRPLEPIPYWDVVLEQDRRIAAMLNVGVTISAEATERMRYVEAVLLHGNASGRHNPTITLPVPWALLDIEAVVGRPDDMAPGSDSAWRAVRRSFDATQGGRLMAAGRAR